MASAAKMETRTRQKRKKKGDPTAPQHSQKERDKKANPIHPPAGGQVQVEGRHVVQHPVQGLLRVLAGFADFQVILRRKFPTKKERRSSLNGWMCKNYLP